MWVSTKPGSTNRPSRFISTVSQASAGSMAAILPLATPISTGVLAKRNSALRKTRSKAACELVTAGFMAAGFMALDSWGERTGVGGSWRLQILGNLAREVFKIYACIPEDEL